MFQNYYGPQQKYTKYLKDHTISNSISVDGKNTQDNMYDIKTTN